MNPETWKRAKQLLGDALEKTPADREAFLRARCQDEPLFDELMTMLAHADDARGASEPLAPGTRIGRYIVEEMIGRGGMGEVYRARDPHLERVVAIKVLAAAYRDDAERLARLKREAIVLASLAHPNIAIIHEIEDMAGTPALVMEFIPGVSLSDRLSSGPLQASDALRLALGIACALEAAHDRGIIHRDLKPGNVMLADAHTVKVLDFGLARPSDLSADAATTAEHMVMGTAAYMSPEQARAEAVDRRTDIWAFGCVLYELLVGVPPFGRHSTPSETIAAVLRSEPDFGKLPSAISVDVLRMIERCVQKDPRRRLQAIGEARLVLEDTINGHVSSAPSPRRRLAPFALVAGFLLAAAVVAWTLRPTSVANSPALHLATRLSNAAQPSFVTISPDGRWLAYVGGEERRLHLRALDSPAPVVRVLPGTDGAEGPFFSPDGGSIAYVAGGELRVVSISGDSPITLLTEIARPFTGGDWSDQGIVIETGDGGFIRVDADGRPATTVVAASDSAQRYGSPQWLGERLLLVSAWTTNVSVGQAKLIDLGSGQQTTLIKGALGARYVPGADKRRGVLLYQGASGLMSLPLDLVRREVAGAATLVAADAVPQQWGRPRFSVSNTGTLVYVATESVKSLASVEWLDGSGRTTPIHLPPGDYTAPRVSPDGTQLALQIRDATADNKIGVFDLRRGSLTIFPIPGHSIRPVWGPDSRQVAFRSDRGTPDATFLMARTDGSGSRVLTTGPITLSFPGSWSGTGGRLVGSGGPAVWAFTPSSVGGQGTLNILERSSGRRDDAVASPRNDHLVAFSSTESGTSQIYLVADDENHERQMVSTDGGTMPRWRGDGRQLFYRHSQQLFVVDVLDGSRPTVSVPRPIASLPADVVAFDVAPAGDRFVIARRAPPAAPPNEVQIIANWQSVIGARRNSER